MVRYIFKKDMIETPHGMQIILPKPWGVSSFIRVFIAITCYNKG